MLTIDKDTSQWQTVTQLIEYINANNIQLNPFILDIGAHDGYTNSNSYPFINYCGWSACLIEPLLEPYIKAKELYKDNQNVSIINCAIGTTLCFTKMFVPLNRDDEQLASLSKFSPELKPIEVMMITPDVLSNYVHGEIGIMTIDTEGWDRCVIEAWFSKINATKPQVIITESWDRKMADMIAKADLLTGIGYKRVLHCGENEIYAKTN